ncbi:MAG: hypothetical protein E7382_00435 [Clostridiales bacterium]|nr:hypothetical protein [Clostridiales bacterium]
MKKSIKKNVVICVICGFLACVFLFISFGVTEIVKKNNMIGEREFNATVLKTVENEGTYIITLDEYKCELLIGKSSLANEKAMASLKKNDKVVFRITKSAEKSFLENQLMMTETLFLKSNGEEIVSYELYKKEQSQAIRNVKTMGVVVSAVFLSIVGLNTYFIVKKKHMANK